MMIAQKHAKVVIQMDIASNVLILLGLMQEFANAFHIFTGFSPIMSIVMNVIFPVKIVKDLLSLNVFRAMLGIL